MKGLVLKSTGSWYVVRTENGGLLRARLRGKFKTKGLKLSNPVAVGDRVTLEPEGEELPRADGSGGEEQYDNDDPDRPPTHARSG